MKRSLSPCPKSPNCVSTLADDPAKRMEPLFFSISVEEAQSILRRVIEAMPRTRLVHEEPGFIHAEFTSRIFRFTDDVEIVLDRENGRVDFRSASRVGYSDLGVNRRRMQAICKQLKGSAALTSR